MKFGKLFWGSVFCLGVAFLGAMTWVHRQKKIDACLDGANTWNYDKSTCVLNGG